MDAKSMLDNVVKIIARTDVDRALALFFMNSSRRAVFREKTVRKFMAYRTVTHTSGIIDGSDIKLARTIEHIGTDNSVARLSKLKSIEDARENGYSDFTATGDPKHYLEVGTEIWLLPVPTTGTVKIYGEFWPADLTDNFSSSDVTTIALPEAFIYLTAAEYFDYFDEAQKAQYWRQKGDVIVAKYLAEDKKQSLYGLGLSSDPLGNGGVQ